MFKAQSWCFHEQMSWFATPSKSQRISCFCARFRGIWVDLTRWCKTKESSSDKDVYWSTRDVVCNKECSSCSLTFWFTQASHHFCSHSKCWDTYQFDRSWPKTLSTMPSSFSEAAFPSQFQPALLLRRICGWTSSKRQLQTSSTVRRSFSRASVEWSVVVSWKKNLKLNFSQIS